MSQGPMSNSPSKGGTMRSQAPTSYQSPFGNQNYRTQTSPSKGGQPSFGGPAYQQPGQFGGQIMNRPMQSPGGKGGYQQPMVQRPMPYPGGKGGGYQRPPTPFGYGQPTFAPQQFSGYGQPSNIFSFNNPHYQPYMPPTYGSGQTGQSPDIGNNPMTPQPEVMAQPVDQQVAVQTEPAQQQVINAIPPELQTRPDPYPATGYNPSMPFFGGKGGARTAGGDILSQYMPPEGYSRQRTNEDYNPDELRVLDPYGPGGSLEGQPRLTFPDPTQPQGPQGNVMGVPMNTPNLSAAGMGSGLGSLFNSQQLAQRLQGAAGGPQLASSDGPENPYAMGGSRNGQINYEQAARDRAIAAARDLTNPRFQTMR